MGGMEWQPVSLWKTSFSQRWQENAGLEEQRVLCLLKICLKAIPLRKVWPHDIILFKWKVYLEAHHQLKIKETKKQFLTSKLQLDKAYTTEMKSTFKYPSGLPNNSHGYYLNWWQTHAQVLQWAGGMCQSNCRESIWSPELRDCYQTLKVRFLIVIWLFNT